MWSLKFCFLAIFTISALAFDLYPPPKRATLAERPFQAAIFRNNQYHCTGALISAHCVLTACSCVYDDMMTENRSSSHEVVNYTVVTHNRFLRPGHMTAHHVSNVFIVGGCDKETNENDAAALCSKDTLPGRPQVMVKEATKDRVRGIVSGWGISVTGEEDIRDNLRRAYMQVLHLEDCRQRYKGIRLIPDSAVCAMATNEVRGFCAGDIGAPLTHGEGLIGIAVASFGCGWRHLPGIFTNVSKIADAVEEVTKQFDKEVEKMIR